MRRFTTISIFALVLATVSFASAQSAPATGITVATTGGAAAVCLSTCGAAATTTESIQISPSFSIENTNLIRPDINLSLYGGGVGYAWNPDAFLKSSGSLIPANTIRFTFHAVPGVLNNGTAGALGTPRFGALGIANVEYAASSDGKYVVVGSVGGMYAPGFGGQNWGAVYSGGFLVNFGGQKAVRSPVAAARKFWGTRVKN